MSKPSRKEKRLTKEELEHKEKIRAEEKRQRALVKDKLYPLLLKHSKSIEDAKNLVYACEMAVRSAFQAKVYEEQARLSKSQVSVLNLEDNIIKDPQFDRDRELLDLFKFETVATTNSILEGMKLALEGFVREECTKRELSTLKTDFLE